MSAFIRLPVPAHARPGGRARALARTAARAAMGTATGLAVVAVAHGAGPVAAETRGGPTIVQGDVLVAEPGALAAGAAAGAAALAPRGLGYARDRLWPDGVMPVALDPALPARTVRAIEGAIELWNSVAGIDIRLVGEGPRPADLVRFEPGEGCASWVGRRGGAQELWVAPDCAAGSIVHELGHALGLEHEHVRPDRDQWIEILWDNVVPEKRHNFDIAGAGLEALGPYDYDSIMHYGPDFFSADGGPTIRPLTGSPRIGQRMAPSPGDVAAIAALYGTDLSLAGSLAPTPGPADGAAPVAPVAPWRGELQLQVTNEGERGAHALELVLPPGVVVDDAVSADVWTCETADGAARGAASVSARCRLERLGAGALSTLALSIRTSDSLPPGTLGDAIVVALEAGSDDPDPSDDRAVLATGMRAPDAFDDTAGAPSAPMGAGKGAEVHDGPPDRGAASPFATLAVAAGAASRPVPEAVELRTIVASGGQGGQGGEGDGPADGDDRFERLFGGAAGALLPLLGLAVGARRLGGRRPGGRRAARGIIAWRRRPA